MSEGLRERKAPKVEEPLIAKSRYDNVKKYEDDDEHTSYVDMVEHFRQQLPSRYSTYQYTIQTIRDIKKSKVTYALGFFACFIVVFVVALMVSVLSHAPIVFLKLAELQSGEVDIYVLPQSSTGYDFLNYTLVNEILYDQNLFNFSSPRHTIAKSIVFYSERQCDRITRDYEFMDWVYTGIEGYTFDNCTLTPTGCFDVLCGNETRGESYLMDSKREWEIGVGRDYPMQGQPIPVGEIHISRELHDTLKIHTGDIIYVRVYLPTLLEGLWNHTVDAYLATEQGEAYDIDQDVPYWEYVYAPFNVTYDFKESYGKIAADYDHVAYFEYQTFLDNFADYFHPSVPEELKQRILSWDLNEYAGQILFNYPPEDRYALYTDSNIDRINQEFVDFASELSYRLGFGQVHTELDILSSLNLLEIFALFLGLILNVITFILLFLSILLIYSLLMVSVETRTFEMGILRMIGMTRGGLIQLLLIQAFLYAIPAWIAGLLMSQVGGYFANLYFQHLTGIPLNANLTVNAFVAATVLGILIPIVSSLLPIRNALGQNLHDAVDARRSKSKAVEIRVSRSEDEGLSVPLLLIGIFLTSFGFAIYYVIPLSLLAEQLSLLLNMFFALLIMMLLGLVMIALNFQRILEVIVTFLCFWWDRKAIRSVVLKNLVAHRNRNRKTTIMYALSLGFIIFIYVSYDVQIRSFIYQEEWAGGTYLNVHASQASFSNGQANRIDIIDELEHWAYSEGYDWAWATMPLRYVVKEFNDAHITNIGHAFHDWNDVYGVTPLIFDVAIPGFLKVQKQRESQYPLAVQLFTPEGTGSAMVGALYQSRLGLRDLDDQFLIEMRKNNGDSPTYHRLNTCAFLDGAAGYKFSRFPTITDQDMLVSLPSFLRLTEGNYRSIQSLPLGTFYIRIPNPTDEELDQIKKELKQIVGESDYSLSIHDYRKNLDIIDQVDLAMQFFFGFTVIVAMAISFFSLISSMYTNVYEQAKEIGILRALGIPYGWMQRIYVYEAFTLVLSASIMGMGIGVGVGWTVAIQRVLFTQLPVPFTFPLGLFGVIFIMAIVFSLISSYGPITHMMNRSIVSILRMF